MIMVVFSSLEATAVATTVMENVVATRQSIHIAQPHRGLYETVSIYGVLHRRHHPHQHATRNLRFQFLEGALQQERYNNFRHHWAASEEDSNDKYGQHQDG